MTPNPEQSERILALAARVEAADGPNYALEVEIFKELHPEFAEYVQGRGGLVHPCDGSDVRVPSDVRPGNYTASIDAAVRLVPEGWCWTINTFGEPNDSASAYVLAETGKMVRPERQYIATPALALCAAALRARAGDGA
jgi:hypothetical protein